ncbi:hypothetical protein EB796_003224 [Bugula neritina]|uniref:Uncharacterized protein n=1 Tax=Bugula neritina TaxID=10212 RepID=A0A7J7KIQ4_BUGNE|nr:hypothetical protein EB796_003224 [Bugula neritina]
MSKLQGMEDMMWYHSPTNSHKVVLFGVTAQAEENIKYLEARFPEFCFEVKPKPNLLTEQLTRSSSLVVEQEKRSSEAIEESTCGLLLEGDSPVSDGTSKIYALTCAHLLFTKSQCNQLLKDKDPSEIQELRDTKIDPPLVHRRYQLKLLHEHQENQKTFDLESRPIYSYRHYTSVGRQHEDGTIRCHQNKCTLSSISVECIHSFMNDTLLLPLKSDSVSHYFPLTVALVGIQNIAEVSIYVLHFKGL